MKKIVSLLLTAVLLLGCFSITAFAVPTESKTGGYHAGEVLVSVQTGSPRSLTRARSAVKDLLKDFEVEAIALLTSAETYAVFQVTLTEKNESAVQDAVSALLQSGDVNFAKPNDDEYRFCIPDDFAPGAVIVSGYGFGELLKDFGVESTRHLTPGSGRLVYLVEFTEKTKEIVWEALEVLENSPTIEYADPDYYAHPCVEEPTPTQSTGTWRAGDPLTADAIVDAANELYHTRTPFPTEDILTEFSYQFEDSTVYAVRFSVKNFCYIEVMLEEQIDGWLLYTFYPQPYIFSDGKLYTIKEAYEKTILSEDMMAELAEASQANGRFLTRCITGDADGDGEVSILDATVVQRYDVGLIGRDAFFKPLGDVDGDDDVNVIDASLIQRSEVGLYTIK